MKTLRYPVIIGVLASLSLLGRAAVAQADGGTALEVKASGKKTFFVNSRAGNSQVTILSESTLEDFTTVCNQVSGECRLEPKHLETMNGRFALKTADMRTGIALRDEHLRGPDWLDAAKNPEVIIELTKAQDARKTGPNTASLTLVGNCIIRGLSKPIQIPCTLTYLDESPVTMKIVKGDVIRLRAEFSIMLSDFGITGPKGSETIGVKVSDVQHIKVSVFAATQPPPKELKVDREPATPAPPGKTAP